MVSDEYFLLNAAQGIYVSRHKGALVREEELYRCLLYIYRTPTLLTTLTQRSPETDLEPATEGSESSVSSNVHRERSVQSPVSTDKDEDSEDTTRHSTLRRRPHTQPRTS